MPVEESEQVRLRRDFLGGFEVRAPGRDARLAHHLEIFVQALAPDRRAILTCERDELVERGAELRFGADVAAEPAFALAQIGHRLLEERACLAALARAIEEPAERDLRFGADEVVARALGRVRQGFSDRLGIADRLGCEREVEPSSRRRARSILRCLDTP